MRSRVIFTNLISFWKSLLDFFKKASISRYMEYTKNVENLKETVSCYEYTCFGMLNPRTFWDFHVYTRKPECLSYVLIIVIIYFLNSENWLGLFSNNPFRLFIHIWLCMNIWFNKQYESYCMTNIKKLQIKKVQKKWKFSKMSGLEIRSTLF